MNFFKHVDKYVFKDKNIFLGWRENNNDHNNILRWHKWREICLNNFKIYNELLKSLMFNLMFILFIIKMDLLKSNDMHN